MVSVLSLSKRIKIDLHQLPTRAKYGIALIVVAVVSLAAWWTSDTHTVGNWQENRLALLLGWLYIVLCVVYLVSRWTKRR